MIRSLISRNGLRLVPRWLRDRKPNHAEQQESEDRGTVKMSGSGSLHVVFPDGKAQERLWACPRCKSGESFLQASLGQAVCA